MRRFASVECTFRVDRNRVNTSPPIRRSSKKDCVSLQRGRIQQAKNDHEGLLFVRCQIGYGRDLVLLI